MNVVIEDNSKREKKLRRFYITLLLICVIAIILALVIQITNENDPNYYINKKLPEISEDKATMYKQEFEHIFENKVYYLENNAYKINKIDKEKEIVYLGYQNTENKENAYDLNVNIPYINIKSETAEKFNKEIKEVFEEKAKNVLKNQNKNTIYTVDYSTYVSNNILSIVIKSTLKEGANAQRNIIQTYNYDLTNHKEYSLNEMLQLRGITENVANQKIKSEIKSSQERVEDLAKLGLEVYHRDYTNDMYKIENSTEYFMGNDNAIYIIYAYGNLNHTSEMDLVVM